MTRNDPQKASNKEHTIRYIKYCSVFLEGNSSR